MREREWQARPRCQSTGDASVCRRRAGRRTSSVITTSNELFDADAGWPRKEYAPRDSESELALMSLASDDAAVPYYEGPPASNDRRSVHGCWACPRLMGVWGAVAVTGQMVCGGRWRRGTGCHDLVLQNERCLVKAPLCVMRHVPTTATGHVVCDKRRPEPAADPG